MQANSGNRLLGWSYAFTILLSAFLLFQVQPLISRYILPWFGGTPAVWTTCMLFFQVLLFGGYAYAHLTSQRLAPRMQGFLHVAIILAAVIVLPISPSATWKPIGNEQPILQIVTLLFVCVGLPFFILSSTGPLLQGWFSRTHLGRSPYRLYALSNAGSLVALITYPFVFEPAFAVQTQAEIWSWGFRGFAVLCAFCAVQMARQSVGIPAAVHAAIQPDESDTEAPPARSVIALWFALPMAASTMLLATTNQVCLDVASVPFLWVLPLTLYLLTFILCFDSEDWYSRRLCAWAVVAMSVLMTTILIKGASVFFPVQALVYFAGLFFVAMVCHGELVRLKPFPRHLTLFYLVISAGGAAGGLFVGLVSPLLFPAYFEFHIAIIGSCVLALIVYYRDPSWVLYRGRPRWAWAGLLLGLATLAGFLGKHGLETFEDTVSVSRNFYGVLRVEELERNDAEKHKFKLVHGRITHGLQFTSDKLRHEPTTYYGRDSGVGWAILNHKPNQSKRVAVVGLGVGTMAAYAKPGDVYRFYEINANVVRIAKKYFHYLSECEGNTEIVMGDARLSMEREESQHYDIIVLDAFSGDAIPTHLLTRQALDVYRKHLNPNGILAIHISNLHFNLKPVVAGLAENGKYDSVWIVNDKEPKIGVNASSWALLSRDPRIKQLAGQDAGTAEELPQPILWTDERTNLIAVLDYDRLFTSVREMFDNSEKNEASE